MELSTNPQAIVLSVLGAIGLYGLLRFFVKREKTDNSAVNWTPFEAVGITVAIYFVSQLLAGVSIGIIGGLMGFNSEQFVNKLENSAALQFSFILIVQTITIGMLYLFMRRRATPWLAIGMVKPKFRDIGYAFAGFGIYFAVYALIVFNLIQHYFPRIDTEQAQELGFSTAAAGSDLILIFLSLVILPPLIEEIMVRGFLFTGLKTKLPLITAAVITSIVFAAAHLQWGSGKPLLWVAAVDTFFLSMVLVWLRQKTGSLWPGIGTHFIKNGLAFLALFVFKIT